jgi:pimeloyl-ACP methyl ester carboxylesterase
VSNKVDTAIDMHTPEPRPLYLNSDADPVFAVFHPANSEAQRQTAVLIAPPFGWEDICSYRSRREWAHHLARLGYPTLRIDLPGTGDSGGSAQDANLVTAWTDAIGSAANWLRTTTYCARLTAIGIGIGGLVICRAIADEASIEEIVLWGTPARGRAFIRELRAFAQLKDSWITAPGQRSITMLEPGTTGSSGFVLSEETTKSLEELDVSRLAFPEGRPRRALLLGRDGIGVDKRLQVHLEKLGADVSVMPGMGFGAMVAPPEEAKAPSGVFALVDSWLSEASADPGVSPASNADNEGPARMRKGSPGPRQGQEGDRELDVQVELLVGDVPIRETPLMIAQPFGHLFGVLAEPIGARTDDLCAILLNAGMIHRIGPNRMWVEIARRWAARGVPTLRVDFIAVGDSDDDGHPHNTIAELYAPEMISQVKSSMDALEARGLGHRFALAGLCSGGYWAFHGALEDKRVRAAFMLNPRALIWDPLLDLRRELRRTLLKPAQWRKLRHSELWRTQVLTRIGEVPHAFVGLLRQRFLRAKRTRSGEDDLDRALTRLADEDKLLLLAFSGEEPLHEELLRQARLGGIASRPNIEIARLPGRDHILSPFEAQQHAHVLLDEALEREIERSTVLRSKADQPL